MVMREKWGSRLGFIMATAGFSIGLGNILRFPYLTGTNGGGAFVLLYLAFSILIGIPLFTAEISLGRKTQLTPIAGMRALCGGKPSFWLLVGWLGVAGALVQMTYYPIWIAWVVGYFFMTIAGQLIDVPAESFPATFEQFKADSILVLAYTGGVYAFVALVVSRGLRGGIERVARFAMPVLFVLMGVLVVRSLSFPGAMEGLLWYVTPDFGAIDSQTALAALGQSFFSIGIGMAAAFGFGSYLHPTDSNIPGNAALVVVCDTLVALLAGLIIFPALFAFGLEPDSGFGLSFVTMTNLFSQMPAGQLFGGLFFFLLFLAGITSALALVEVLCSTVSDVTGTARGKTAWTISGVLFATSIPMVLSQGPWGSWRFWGKDLLTLTDDLLGSFVLPMSALALALYVAYRWRFARFRDETNVGSGIIKVSRSWRPFVSFLIPAAVGVLLLIALGVF